MTAGFAHDLPNSFHNLGSTIIRETSSLSGTTVSFFSSMMDGLSADNPKADNQHNPPKQANSHKVLVVDDDADVLAAVCDSLDIYNIANLSTRSGKEAIKLYAANQQDIVLILLDLKMPEMSGETVYKELCKINPNVSFLISSGYYESDIMSRFIGAGQIGFLPKPFNINQLIKAVREHFPK